METPLVAFLQGDQMIVDLGGQVDLRMQMPEPLAAIELKDHCTPRHLHAFLVLNRALHNFQSDRPNGV